MKLNEKENFSIRSFTLADSISIFRMVVAPFVIFIAFLGEYKTYAWLMILLFFTDMADGFIARLRNEISRRGARLDSIADLLMVAAAVMGILKFQFDVVWMNFTWVLIAIFLYLLTISISLFRYGKISSFHTYLSKLSALLMVFVFIQLFFFSFHKFTFVFSFVIYIISALEELIILMINPNFKTDVKGLYWLMRLKK